MRAQFVFEKFTNKTDPIRDMNIGLTFPEVLIETAIDLFGDQVMFWEMKIKKGKQYQLKGIPPYYDLNSTMPLTREQWKELRKVVGKPIPREYIALVRVPYEGRNMQHLRLPFLLDEIYDGDFYFIENDAIVEVVNDDQVITQLKPGDTFKIFYNNIKEYYAS